MELPLAYFGDPILRKKAAPITEITEEIHQLVADMKETLLAQNGVGLAAPQVKHSVRLFLSMAAETPEPALGEEIFVFINPVLSEPSDTLVSMEEGCLSIPGIRGDVFRPDAITVEALDLEGNPFKKRLIGYPARVVMHENDHLNGVLYPDRMDPQDKKEIEPYLRKVKKEFKTQ